MNDDWHSQVTASIGGKANYGKGIWPNPWHVKIEEYTRRQQQAANRTLLTHKIQMLTEPRFIAGSETSEFLESLATMLDARQILELGTCTGRTSLHLLRAIIGKPGAKLVSIDARPAIDREFFAQFSTHFEFIHGWTPACLAQLAGRTFDLVFVDSDHSVEHTQKEIEGLKPITRKGSIFAFHDCPEWQTPANRVAVPVRTYLESLIASREFSGIMLPSPRQLDCEQEWGKDYPMQCSPGLAVLVRL